MRKTIAKNYLTKFIVCAFLCVCLMMTAVLSLSVRANNEQEEDREFSQRILNEQFADTSTWPSSPNNWTGEYIEENNGNVVSGIIPLSDTYISNYDSFKLDIYPEYDNKNKIPKTPFGGASTIYEGTNRNVLMINTNKSQTAYGYTYTSTNLEANSFYRFKAYVKTGKFAQASGAAISLTGLKEPVGIWDINTIKFLSVDDSTKLPILEESNLWGWKDYTIYVATGANSESVGLKLSVGDCFDGFNSPANGYAFFDNITIDKLSPTNYYSEIEYVLDDDDNIEIYDMNPIVNDSLFTNGELDSAKKGWSKIKEIDGKTTDSISWDYYNAGNKFIKNNTFGMKKDPYTPKGKFDEDNTIMVLSSFDKPKDEDTNEFKSVSAGITSQPFVVEKEKFYLLSFWYNTEEITGGAAAVIRGESTIYSKQYKLDPVAIENLTSNNNKERYGWQRANFYIKGSLIKNVELSFEFWLGYTDKASGIAMLDYVALAEIDYFEFSENKLGGQVVSVDQDDSVDENSAISNSRFSQVEYQKDDKGVALPLTYPAKPASWTLIEPIEEVEENDIAHGVVPTEENHYDSNRANYLSLQNPKPVSEYANKNVLLLASRQSTAFGYQSQAFTISATQQYRLDISLEAKITSGYGASLLIKRDNKVVSSIEKIFDTNGEFVDYTFYLAGGSQQVSLSLEIWLGLDVKRVNTSNLSTGHIFVNTVELKEVYPEENGTSLLEIKAQDFVKPNFNPTSNRYSMYSPGSLDFSAFDRYSDEAIKTAYDMVLSSTTTARAGIIGIMPKNQNEILDFDKIYASHMETEYRSENIVYMRNVTPGYSKLQSNYTLNFDANKHYRIDFSILVDLYDSQENGKTVGAGIWLGENSFQDIRSTYKTPHAIIDYDKDNKPIYQKELEFKQYSILYASSDVSEQLEWYLTLGANQTNQEIAGRLFLNSVVVTEIDSYAFEEIEAEQEELEDDEKDPYLLIKNNSVTDEAEVDSPTDDLEGEGDENTTNDKNKPNELPWYLIPSIALVLAMVIAVVVISYKKIKARHPKSKNRQKVVSYDRRHTINKMDADAESKDAGTYIYNDTTFDSFDDDQIIESPKQKHSPDSDSDADADVNSVQEPETIAEEEPAKTPSVIKKQDTQENEFDD